MSTLKVLVVSAVITVTLSSSSAFAWGCLAVAYNGGKGWSYHYSSRDGAIARALEECTPYGRGCRIVRCDRWR
jgi:hypothetical protein